MRQKAMFIVPYALWIILFVIAPLVLILYQSFFNINGQLTLNNYAEYLTSGVYLKMTLNSVWYAFLITLVTLVISYPTAYVLNRLPNKQFWLLLVILPTWINLLLKTYAFIGLFSRTGTINGSSSLWVLGATSFCSRMLVLCLWLLILKFRLWFCPFLITWPKLIHP